MDKASLLAKTVYEGVRQRVQQLQADVQARDQQVAALQADLEAAALQRDVALKQAQSEQQVRGLLLPMLLSQSQHMADSSCHLTANM